MTTLAIYIEGPDTRSFETFLDFIYDTTNTRVKRRYRSAKVWYEFAFKGGERFNEYEDNIKALMAERGKLTRRTDALHEELARILNGKHFEEDR